MWMLLALTPAVDTLTPYFEGHVVARPAVTLEAPCPDGSDEAARHDRVVTCTVAAAPGDALELTFDEHGTLVAYQTFARGVRSGTSGRWTEDGVLVEWTRWREDRRNGKHVIYDEPGNRVLEETYVDDRLDGPYSRRVTGDHRDSGQYVAGQRAGMWTEWRANGSWRGSYLAGARTGTWVLARDQDQLSPDYTVRFEAGAPVAAERTVARYHGLMGGIDAALLGIAIYGHHAHRPDIELAGGVAFFALPPLVHLVEQPAGKRRDAVGLGLGVRPAAVATVLMFYTIGKAIDALDCHETHSDDGPNSCGDVSFDFDGHYNWNAVLLVSGLLAAVGDVDLGSVRRPVPVDEAWLQVTQIGMIPMRSGGGIGVSGAF